MTEEQRQNALQLLDWMENRLTDNQCDMHYWARRVDDQPIPPREQRGQHDCGTAACLAGWAALLLAPTEDIPGEVAHRTAFMVPYEFANKICQRKYGGGPSYLTHDGKAMLPIDDIGTALLGDEFEKWFGDTDGPAQCGMGQREWMIAVLRKNLGMEYNTDLVHVDDRDDDLVRL